MDSLPLSYLGSPNVKTLEKIGISLLDLQGPNSPGNGKADVSSIKWNLMEEMATYSSILAWKIPWTEVLGGLHSKGFQRVGHH